MPACARILEPCEFMPENYFITHNPSAIFGNDHPLEIDLGCGDGSFLIEMAKHYPERNFLGVERLLGRVRSTCKQIQCLGITNARVLRLESQYTLEWLLAPSSVSRLHLLCPDPWPKARHHKRRLVRQPFLATLHKTLAPTGEFFFKTDHTGYFEWVCGEMEIFGGLTRLPWPDDKGEGCFFYPKTDFQRLWESKGKTIHRLRYEK